MQSNQTNVDKMYKATRVGNCLLKEAKVLHGDNCNRRQPHAHRKQRLAEIASILHADMTR